MNRVFHITVVILFFALKVAAQGDVVVHTDPRLSILLNKKHVAVQASVTKPASHHEVEAHVAPNGKIESTAHFRPEPGTTATAINTKPAEESKRSISAPVPAAGTAPPTPDNSTVNSTPVTPAPVKPTIIIHEKEGRVIYTGKGFRVQIFSGSDRDKAIAVKTEFMRRFPGIRTYLIYNRPCFRVKVGNYRNRGEAAVMLKEANRVYSPCVIVPDSITINSF
jgi:hypothetical protein